MRLAYVVPVDQDGRSDLARLPGQSLEGFNQRAGEMAQWVKHLLCKCVDLSGPEFGQGWPWQCEPVALALERQSQAEPRASLAGPSSPNSELQA